MSIIDNRTKLSDCENNNNVSGDTTSAPTLAVSATGTTIEGTNSIGFQCDDAQEVLLFDQDSSESTFNLDLSDSTVYLNVKHNLGETFANLGGLVAFCDSADGGGGDCIGYAVNGSDVAGFPYIYRFTAIKLDVSVIVASPGTDDVDYYTYNGTEAGLNHAAILQVGYGTFNITKAVSSALNAWIDGIYYIANDSYAATITGGTSGTPETMVDVAADDLAVGMGLFNNPKGTEYGFFGPTQWGDTGTGNSYFTSSGEQWYLIGDNAGGHAVGSTHFPFRLIGNSTGTNSWVLSSTVIVNTGTLCQLDLSNADMDTATMDGCSLIGLGAIELPNAGTAKTTLNCIFSGCGVITSNGGDMTGSSILAPAISANTSGLVWNLSQDPDGELDNMTFTKTSGTAHHAIEFGTAIPSGASYTLRGCNFGTDFSATEGGTTGDETFHFLDTTGTITLNLVGCTGNFGYRTAGVTVTIVEDPVTVSITVTDAASPPVAIDSARVFLETSNGTGPLPFEDSVSIVQTSGTATVTHTTHGLVTGNYVVIRGATQNGYNKVAAITVTTANAYTYAVDSGTDSPATGSPVSSGVIISGLTNGSGLITDTRTYSSNQPFKGWARKSSSQPYYVNGAITGTISSVDGFTASIALLSDE